MKDLYENRVRRAWSLTLKHPRRWVPDGRDTHSGGKGSRRWWIVPFSSAAGAARRAAMEDCGAMGAAYRGMAGCAKFGNRER